MSTTANGPSETPGIDAGGSGAPATDRLAEHAHRAVDGAAASAAQAEREIRRTAASAGEHVERREEQLTELLDQNLRKVREYIEKNPIQSAGIAFAAGVVLSSLLRR